MCDVSSMYQCHMRCTYKLQLNPSTTLTCLSVTRSIVLRTIPRGNSRKSALNLVRCVRMSTKIKFHDVKMLLTCEFQVLIAFLLFFRFNFPLF